MHAYEEFEWRGLVHSSTEGLRHALAAGPITVYSGFDPTGSSLHVGHLLPVTGLARLQRLGHRSIAVVGGGTGLIGDPSGKASERTLLSIEQVEANVAKIRDQLSRFLEFDACANAALLVNNAEWLTTMSAMEFLRDVGKHFTVNAMLAKESVRRRLESEDGISYTEFSYSLLQAYDYVMLHRRHDCTLQIGGSDQWGNILSGCDLIRRLTGRKVHGLVMPLLTTSTGTKFGKTESGAVWLDPALTTPYDFYQFWLNTEDRDAGRYLRFFTFLEQPAIEALEEASAREPEKRHAQRALAREVTTMVHGAPAVHEIEATSEKLFGGDVAALSVAELLQVFANVPSCEVPPSPDGWAVTELLTTVGAASSRSDAMRLIRGGGVYVNDRRIGDERERLRSEHAIEHQVFVLRRGKKDYFLVKVVRG